MHLVIAFPYLGSTEVAVNAIRTLFLCLLLQAEEEQPHHTWQKYVYYKKRKSSYCRNLAGNVESFHNKYREVLSDADSRNRKWDKITQLNDRQSYECCIEGERKIHIYKEIKLYNNEKPV